MNMAGNYTKLLNNLDELKLVKFKENLDSYIDMSNEGKSFTDWKRHYSTRS